MSYFSHYDPNVSVNARKSAVFALRLSCLILNVMATILTVNTIAASIRNDQRRPPHTADKPPSKGGPTNTPIYLLWNSMDSHQNVLYAKGLKNIWLKNVSNKIVKCFNRAYFPFFTWFKIKSFLCLSCKIPKH